MQPFALFNTREASAGVIALRLGLMCLLAGVVVAGCGGEGTCKPEVLAGTVDTELHLGVTCDQVHVSEDIYVTPRGNLIIRHGTTLTFKPDTGLFVDGGGITAPGTEKLPILMKGEYAITRQWKGIAIKNGSREVDRILTHVTIQHAGSAAFADSQPGSLVIFEAADQKTATSATHLTVLNSKGFGVVINSPTQPGDETCGLRNLSFSDIENDEVFLNGGGSCLLEYGWEQAERASPRAGRALIGAHGSAQREGYSSDAFLYRTEKDIVLNNQDLWLSNGVEISFINGASLIVKGISNIGASSARPGILRGYDWGGIVIEGGAKLRMSFLRVTDDTRPLASEPDQTEKQKASISISADASFETYEVEITRHRGFGIKAEDGAELEVKRTSIQVFDGAAASVGWPAILGFGDNNEFGAYSGDPTSAVVLNTELDTSQLDLALGYQGNNFRIRDLAFRKLFIGAGVGLQIESDGVIEIGEGGIHLSGRPELPILIGGVDRDGRWKGLRLVGQSTDNRVRHTVFRQGGDEGTPVLSVSTGNTVEMTGTAYVNNNGPGLHIEDGAVVSGCSTLTFEEHRGARTTGAPCVD